MTNLENLRKQAKQLQRWHRGAYYPVAARIRAGLPAFRSATDAEILAAEFPLARAQELVAREQGFPSWQALRSEWSDTPMQSTTTESRLIAAYPQILTTDMEASRAFYVDQLGFTILYEYGKPPFYALVARDDARLNLRFVHQHLMDRDLAAAENVLAAYVPVQRVKDFYLELRERGVQIIQQLTAQPWGVRDFILADPDGNQLCFAEATDHDHDGPRR